MPKNTLGPTLVQQMDVFLPSSNRKIFLFQSFCLLLFDNLTFMKAIKKIEVNTKNKKSLSLTVKKWLEDYLKLQENILSFVVEVKQIKESKEYFLDWSFNLKPDADKNEYFDLLNLLTFDLSQKAIGRHSEEFKTLQIKDF